MQRNSRWISRLMLVVVLFAQSILAAHACVVPDASAAQSLAMAAPEVETMPCHEPEKPNLNECLMHCTQADQVNLDLHTIAAVPSDVVVLKLDLPLLHNRLLIAQYHPLVLNTGPPLSIRFCSFLI